MEKLGHTEVVSMSLGALIGGGIFAVLGVAANIAGRGVIISYLLAGIIALASGYSYGKLSAYYNEDGGSFRFIKNYTNSVTVAGLISWFLILGYIGSMAMYSYAFGAFMYVLIQPITGSIPILRVLISVMIILLFLIINLRGVESSGKTENLMVYGKVAILLIFGIIGLISLNLRASQSVSNTLPLGTNFTIESLNSPLMAISVIFVSFQGFQLLCYNLTEIKGGANSLQKGIFQSLIAATLIYILIAFITTALLTPAEIIATEETVLAYAATKMFHSSLIQEVAFIIIAVAALFSTASAINATLFSTARLISTVAEEGQLPQLLRKSDYESVPRNSLIALSIITVFITSLGSLQEITSYASVSFLLIFCVVNYIAMKTSDLPARRLISVLGFAGTLVASLIFVYYTYSFDFGLLTSIGSIFLLVILIEIIYFGSKHIRLRKRKFPPSPIYA